MTFGPYKYWKLPFCDLKNSTGQAQVKKNPFIIHIEKVQPRDYHVMKDDKMTDMWSIQQERERDDWLTDSLYVHVKKILEMKKMRGKQQT